MATFELSLSHKKDSGWKYKLNHPKSSKNLPKNSQYFESLSDLYKFIVEKANVPEKETHLHIYYRYRNRKIEIYHNWKHEWISSAQNHEKVQHNLDGNWGILADALVAAKKWIDEDLKLSKPRLIAKIKELPNTFFVFLCYIIGMLPGISCLVAVYWFYHRNERDQSFENHTKLTYGIYISAFITLLIVLYIGIKSSLFFIPYKWGSYDEDGEWISYREWIAALLSLFSAGFIVRLFEKYERLVDKIKNIGEENNKKSN